VGDRLVIVKIADQPGPGELVSVREGAYLALAASISIVAGGLAANR
jgi:hypothetical protein